ncbi:hypothetical protein EX30DRAFT_53195 [Ascodesmis nigricans]|uniref:Uncharacterized protein n=1 Tax=Ascodesmis nigricans TaxID=341454 RepID=A0A4S2MVB9_9PEZI|nr:hypothetical protein EX30DRAFT_53195 [Ascodesmis nigricans]
MSPRFVLGLLCVLVSFCGWISLLLCLLSPTTSPPSDPHLHQPYDSVFVWVPRVFTHAIPLPNIHAYKPRELMKRLQLVLFSNVHACPPMSPSSSPL